MHFYRPILGALLILLNIINLPHNKRGREKAKKRLIPQTALTLTLLLGGLSYTAADTLNMPLTFEAWQHYTLSSQGHQGQWEHTADGIRLYGSESGHGNGIMSKDRFDFRGTETLIKWQVNSHDQYSALLPHLKSLTGSALLSERFTTHHTEPGATLISDKTWYYTKITVNRDSTYTAITAQDDYDFNGGFVIHSQFGTFNGAQEGYVAIYLADNDTGQLAYLTLGEVKIKPDVTFSTERPIDFNQAQRSASTRQGTRQEPKPIEFDYQIKLSWNDYQTVDDSNDSTTTTPEAKTSNNTYSGSISDSYEKQTLKTVPRPKSQFEEGIVKDVECQPSTENAKVALECKKSGEEFVVSAYSKAPVAQFSNSHRYDVVVEQDVITLDGTQSKDDKDSSSLSYNWTTDGKTDTGPTVNWQFDAGEHEICLVVTDSDGIDSEQECETLTVAPCTYTPTLQSPSDLDSNLDTGSLTITTNGSRCPWEAQSQESWLTIDAGSHTGTLAINYSVTDNPSTARRCGNLTVAEKSIEICQQGNKSPTAAFTATPSGRWNAPVTVTFNASASRDTDGSISQYRWTISDGSALSGRQATKTFQNKGSYTITLEVTDNDRATHTTSQPITVQPPFYTLNINNIGTGQGTVTGGQTGSSLLEGTSVTLTATSMLGSTFAGWSGDCYVGTNPICSVSMDRNKNVTAQFDLCTYRLDSSSSRTHPAKGDDDSVRIIAPKGCPWTALIPNQETWLTIEPSSGSGDGTVKYTVAAHPDTIPERTAILNIAGQNFTVKQKGNKKPTGSFTANPPQGNTPLSVSLNASNSNDQDGEITEYKWTDSKGKTLSEGKEPETTIELTESGNHTLSLVVSDEMGTPSSAVEKTVFVNTPPIAEFTVSPKKGKVPLTVTLDASASSDEDGHEIKYEWKSDYSGQNGPTASGVKTTMTLDKAEPYLIELIVTDELGATDSKTVPGIFVDKNPPPEAQFTVSPGLKGKAPFTVELDASSSDDDDLETLTYQWNIDGKGSFSVVKPEAITFEEPGIYSVELIVIDDKGLTGTETKIINVVENEAPVALFKWKVDYDYENNRFQVTLNPSDSSDPDGLIKQYKWSSTAGHNETSSNPEEITLYFDSAGEYTITLIVEDEQGETGSRDKEIDLIEPGKVGQAIIVVAGGAKRENTRFSSSNKLAAQVYKILNTRGFTDDDIQYMNPYPPDINDDGYLDAERQDYDLKEAESDFTKAFDQAASSLKPDQQFVFYLHGHGEKDYFQINDKYTLKAEDFRALLDKIPDGVEQVIILDTCYSGSFVDDLKGAKNRIVITSTDDHSRAWAANDAGLTIVLFPQLYNSWSFKDAFQYAQDKLKLQGKQFADQEPWLDADSDGSVNTSKDYEIAGKSLLGSISSLGDLPAITTVHNPLSLDGTSARKTLWVQIESHEPKSIKKVRAVLFRPDFQANEYKGEDTKSSGIELVLDYNESQKRYEVAYDYFCHSGVWKVMYQAQSVHDFWSEFQFGEIEQLQDTCYSVEMGLNKDRYTTGDTFHLDMIVDGKGDADVYVVIALPDGGIFLYQSSGFSQELQPYYSGAPIDGKYVHPVLDITLPADLPSGNDSFVCGILAPPNADILNSDTWIDWHCSQFELY